jgi:hypothetical protein
MSEQLELLPENAHVIVDDVPSGYEWRIVDDDDREIAGSRNKRYIFPREAHEGALQWMRRHRELGYPLRAGWELETW